MRASIALFLFLALVISGRADDKIAGIQQSLKDQGFYYGEITGEKNADTTAAIRRYQIRNGLQVTGELNDETMRSLKAAPKAAQKKLREMRACIRTSAPGAKESLKWGMPAFSDRRILVTFAAYKHHIGFYPTPTAVKAFERQLSKFVTAKASIQFPLEKPLPLPLIRKITAFRVRESIEVDRKWKTPSH